MFRIALSIKNEKSVQNALRYYVYRHHGLFPSLDIFPTLKFQTFSVGILTLFFYPLLSQVWFSNKDYWKLLPSYSVASYNIFPISVFLILLFLFPVFLLFVFVFISHFFWFLPFSPRNRKFYPYRHLQSLFTSVSNSSSDVIICVVFLFLIYLLTFIFFSLFSSLSPSYFVIHLLILYFLLYLFTSLFYSSYFIVHLHIFLTIPGYLLTLVIF